MTLAAETAAALPADRPRYLMGVGLPEDLIRFVGMGYDLFDCVLPTRNARNGMLFTSTRPHEHPPGTLRPRRGSRPTPSAAATPAAPSAAPTCATWPRPTRCSGAQLASLHNLHFYQQLMRDMRAAIARGDFAAWSAARLARLTEGDRRMITPAWAQAAAGRRTAAA